MSGMTRRALLRGAAGAAAGAGAASLPAWARFALPAATRLRRPDSRPFPHLPAGQESMPEIKHVVVLIMENTRSTTCWEWSPTSCAGGAR